MQGERVAGAGAGSASGERALSGARGARGAHERVVPGRVARLPAALPGLPRRRGYPVRDSISRGNFQMDSRDFHSFECEDTRAYNTCARPHRRMYTHTRAHTHTHTHTLTQSVAV